MRSSLQRDSTQGSSVCIPQAIDILDRIASGRLFSPHAKAKFLNTLDLNYKRLYPKSAVRSSALASTRTV